MTTRSRSVGSLSKVYAQPDPLRRLPSDLAQSGVRRQGSGALPPCSMRNPQAKQSRQEPERRSRAYPGALSPKPTAPDRATTSARDLEVLRIGQWSVRRPADPDARPIFVNLDTGISQEEPPEEVLRELAAEDDTEDQEMNQTGTASTRSCEDMAQTASTMNQTTSSHVSSQELSFRRILLGERCEVPLMMARDILAALREDASLFDEVQKRFSDNAEEPPLQLGIDLPEDLEEAATGLGYNEISDVIATPSGMQILLRVQ